MSSETFLVRIEPLGRAFEASRDETVLAAARAAGVVLPSSCRNGTCRTCMCLAVAGHVSYRIAWPGLSLEEKQDGYILPCVARPESALTLKVPFAKQQPTAW